MGHKVHPKSFRLGVNRTWDSRWYAKKDYAHNLHRDIVLRKAIKERLKESGIAKIEIERMVGSVKVNVFTSKPGMIIGRQGIAIEDLRHELSSRFNEKIEVNIIEIKKPDMDAQLIAENIAGQIERRIPYRRVAKQSLTRGIENGLLGIKIRVGGRLNGAEISREETFKEGNIPLHTLRSDIDYGVATARTTYGAIGVKVWVYKGQIFGFSNEVEKKADDKNWLAANRKGAEKVVEKEVVGRLEAELAVKKSAAKKK